MVKEEKIWERYSDSIRARLSSRNSSPDLTRRLVCDYPRLPFLAGSLVAMDELPTPSPSHRPPSVHRSIQQFLFSSFPPCPLRFPTTIRKAKAGRKRKNFKVRELSCRAVFFRVVIN
jgi:hypothetical protein